MDIRVTQAHGQVPITIFHIEGSVHLGNAEELEQQARGVIENGTRNLLLDLTLVPSMTSAGLRVLHILYKLLESGASQQAGDVSRTDKASDRSKSSHIKLANPSPSLLRVLTIAGFDTFLEIYENVPDALASFSI